MPAHLSPSAAVVDVSSQASVDQPNVSWLDRLQWQPVVFAERPRRVDLLRLAPTWPCRSVSLRIHRNYPIELVTAMMSPFLAFAGLSLERVDYSGYDDSLTVEATATDQAVDVELVSLDFERYRGRLDTRGLTGWLGERLDVLRADSSAPILVTDWAADDPAAVAFNRALRASLDAVPGIYVCAVSSRAQRLGKDWRDERTAGITGTNLSDAAIIALARELGLAWLPAILQPRIKAVVVDLDYTLYGGAIGENDANELTLTEGHATLQRKLNGLRDDGILLGVVSRNQRDDVRRLFAARADFPLRPEHVSAWAVSWDSKAAGIGAIAAQLNIGTDAMLMVDDNPGELAVMAAAFPGMRLLHCGVPTQAAKALEFYPGLFVFSRRREDDLRAADLSASYERAALASTITDHDGYLQSLGIELTFESASPVAVGRIHELSIKTNQFNTALRRFGAAELAGRLADGSLRGVTVALQDRLSESGTIAVVLACRNHDRLVIEEIAISCRALGRTVEDVIVTEALRHLLSDGADAPATQVAVAYRTGPRNQPAMAWLAAYTGQSLGTEGEAILDWEPEWASEIIGAKPVSLKWR